MPERDPIGPGQRSVWDFPRPAIAQPSDAHVRIEHQGVIIAESRDCICTFETSHPPSYYIPPDAIAPGVLRRGDLVFWEGHVGILEDAGTVIHANAFHLGVAREPLGEATMRIRTVAGDVTGVRRVDIAAARGVVPDWLKPD